MYRFELNENTKLVKKATPNEEPTPNKKSVNLFKSEEMLKRARKDNKKLTDGHEKPGLFRKESFQSNEKNVFDFLDIDQTNKRSGPKNSLTPDIDNQVIRSPLHPSEIQSRHWSFLSDNLYRFMEEIYETCKHDSSLSVRQYKDVAFAVDSFSKKFNKLINGKRRCPDDGQKSLKINSREKTLESYFGSKPKPPSIGVRKVKTDTTVSGGKSLRPNQFSTPSDNQWTTIPTVSDESSSSCESDTSCRVPNSVMKETKQVVEHHLILDENTNEVELHKSKPTTQVIWNAHHFKTPRTNASLGSQLIPMTQSHSNTHLQDIEAQLTRPGHALPARNTCKGKDTKLISALRRFLFT